MRPYPLSPVFDQRVNNRTLVVPFLQLHSSNAAKRYPEERNMYGEQVTDDKGLRMCKLLQ